MSTEVLKKLISVITEAAEPLQESPKRYDALLSKIGDSRFVLIGKASHGTKEFYQSRIEITQQIVRKRVTPVLTI